LAITDVCKGVLIYLGFLIIGIDQFSSFHLALVLVASLLPDWDFALYFLVEKRTGWLYSHRQLFGHFPLLYAVALCLARGAGILSEVEIALISVALTSHFISDTMDVWGIAWLAPFSRKRLCLREGRLNIVPSWHIPEEGRKMKAKE